ncbi:MAG TPA: hypothetical protein VFJ61_00970 [Solirubrobacterales bacterium]|nr:hypothetical protein [Solirubrobacterales bacterium]
MNVVLSYGLGVDSTALLLRWLEEPSSRDFELSDLIVVTAMTGDEWPRTGVLVEAHILPRLRRAGVRFAQVARGGLKEADGIVVLDDTVAPTRLQIAGAYKLSDELTSVGTVPQASGNRLCSIKFKGWVIDNYLRRHAPRIIRHAFGYEAGEVGRAEKCASHMPGRMAFGFSTEELKRATRATEYDTSHKCAIFPLIEWGWHREDCRRFIEQVTGVPDWPKSACVYCPFALTSRAGRERTLARFDTRPESAIEALILERRSLCLNPKGGLIAGDRLCDLISVHRPAIFATFNHVLDSMQHSVYEVKRIWQPKKGDDTKVGNVFRYLRVAGCGSRVECEADVRSRGPLDQADDFERCYVRRRDDLLPAREHFFVAGPAGAVDKWRPSFASRWHELNQEQLTLASAL